MMWRLTNPTRTSGLWWLRGMAALGLLGLEPVRAGDDPNDPVLRAEAARIAAIATASPAVVCVYDEAQRGGGSGVLIDPAGYGLTNFHVVAGMIEKRRGWGGLSDGKLYELEVLGIDPTGDVAMFRLTGREAFPYAPLGNSDGVRVGDEVMAMGNPFVLSEDYTPSVSMGIVSGTHRYQYGVGGNLAYTDCIQVDAAINPGNSGGPLFNEVGQVIGINGRISVSARGRLNVGHGYAISSNQIQRFMPALRAGLIARHGTLGATVAEPELRHVVFDEVTPGGAASRAGVRRGDRLVSFDSTPMGSRNQFASMLGTYPADWPVVLEVDSDGKLRPLLIRLDPVNPRMAKPFAPDRAVNLREVRRLLAGFRRAVLRDASARIPKTWRWTASRKYAFDPAAPRNFDEVYEVRSDGDGPVRMTRRYEDGRGGPVIVFDETKAEKHLTADGDTMEMPTEDRMVLASLFVLQRRLLLELSDDDLANVAHTGGDAIVAIDDSKKTAGGEAGPDGQRRAGPALEVIDWPIGEATLAKYMFDSETGRVVRIRVRDVPTGVEATIDFADYGWVAGLVWPQAIEVKFPGRSYRETWSNWNLGE